MKKPNICMTIKIFPFFLLSKGAKIYATLLALFFGKVDQIIESNESSPSASVTKLKA